MGLKRLLQVGLLSFAFQAAAGNEAEAAPQKTSENLVEIKAHCGKKPPSVVIDAETGEILAGHCQDQKLLIASVTKVMTAALVFEMLDKGLIKKETILTAPKERLYSRWMKLRAGKQISVDDALKGLLARSDNMTAETFAAAIPEIWGGKRPDFIALMNARAEEWGLTETVFKDPHGLYNLNKATPADMARLFKKVNDKYPALFGEYMGIESFRYKGRKIYNTNPMLKKSPDVVASKTGYMEAAGLCLVSLAKKGGHEMITAVFGARSRAKREAVTKELLDAGEKALRKGRNPSRL